MKRLFQTLAALCLTTACAPTQQILAPLELGRFTEPMDMQSSVIPGGAPNPNAGVGDWNHPAPPALGAGSRDPYTTKNRVQPNASTPSSTFKFEPLDSLPPPAPHKKHKPRYPHPKK